MKKEPVICCETWEVVDKNIHCVHLHFFNGTRSVRHKKCCDHSHCVALRAENVP